MPVQAKVRLYDAEKGFGFLTKDEGGGTSTSARTPSPPGVTTLKAGQKVESRRRSRAARGEQALVPAMLEAPPSLSKDAPGSRRSRSTDCNRRGS